MYETTAERVEAVKAMLESGGELWREQVGNWIVELLPVEVLVPEKYVEWRPLVRDAMFFMASRLSAGRLAPKIVEQIELPRETPPEARLLHLIAKVPGLQKLGQVLARNRHLHSRLRRALSELENGISDVSAEDVHAIIFRELGPRLETFAVELEAAVFSEASVSAVVRFTWRDPDSGRRERGVFKVLKPHIPSCFAEDMDLLQQLSSFLASRHDEYGFSSPAVPETFAEVRQFLEREVDFPREQATLVDAARIYSTVPHVRVPRLVGALCATGITAITEEEGIKVTGAFLRASAKRRSHVAEQLVEALIAVPLFSTEEDAIFHADPHAGNLLYNERTGDLVILDWALTERLSREQRRNIIFLAVMTALRDPGGVCLAIHALSQNAGGCAQSRDWMIRECVAQCLDKLPSTGVPGSLDAMRLLDRIARDTVRFPAALLMFRKVMFTLDGVLSDIAQIRTDVVLARYLLARWTASLGMFRPLLLPSDWLAIEWSLLNSGSRLWIQTSLNLLGIVERIAGRYLPPRAPAAAH